MLWVSKGTGRAGQGFLLSPPSLRSPIQAQAHWFGGLAITLEAKGETLLTGSVANQAALCGLLRKVRNVGLHGLGQFCESRSGRGMSCQRVI